MNADMKPGDLLLYAPKGLWGWLIVLKTWARPAVSHCEIYAGDGVSFASRERGGVNYYPTRPNPRLVLRPNRPLDLPAMKAWCDSVQGQKYDYIGVIFNFFAAKVAAQDKQWCSEAATRAYRAGGLEPFHPDYDADRVAPATFLASGAFDLVKD